MIFQTTWIYCCWKSIKCRRKRAAPNKALQLEVQLRHRSLLILLIRWLIKELMTWRLICWRNWTQERSIRAKRSSVRKLRVSKMTVVLSPWMSLYNRWRQNVWFSVLLKRWLSASSAPTTKWNPSKASPAAKSNARTRVSHAVAPASLQTI